MRRQNDRLSLIAQLPDGYFDIVRISGIKAAIGSSRNRRPRIGNKAPIRYLKSPVCVIAKQST